MPSNPLAQSTGTRLWVAPSGSDSAPGTETAPLRTIARAFSLAAPGQRVTLKPGTYPDRVISAPRGTSKKPITLEPDTGARAVVTAGFKLDGAAYVRVRGLVFDGTGSTDWARASGPRTTSSSPATEILGYREQALLIKSGTDVHLIRNHIHLTGGSWPLHDHGIYCEYARRAIVVNNLVYDMIDGYGVHAFGDCDDAQVVYNTIAFRTSRRA